MLAIKNHLKIIVLSPRSVKRMWIIFAKILLYIHCSILYRVMLKVQKNNTYKFRNVKNFSATFFKKCLIVLGSREKSATLCVCL